MGFLSIPAARVAMEALGSCSKRRMGQPLSLLLRAFMTNMERAIIATCW